MGRRRRKPKIVTDVLLTDMVAGGKAMARQDGKVIFVENAVPGDLVDVFVQKRKKDYDMGKISVLKKASEHRTEPFCTHFGSCGGCKWQYLTYPQQLIYKEAIVKDAFNRVGKLDYPELMPILGATPNQYYRNKLEFTFSPNRWLTAEQIASGKKFEQRNVLGFHVPGMFDRIVDIDHCYLQGEPSNDIRNEIRNFALANELTFYNAREHTGFLRNLIIRTSTLKELMVIVIFGEEIEEKRTALLEHIRLKFPEITSLQYVINKKKNDSLFDQEVIGYSGEDYIHEKLEDLTFKISPKSFFQTNSFQAVHLYQTIRDFANLQGEEMVYDLYTGTGSIALFVAKNCKKIVGIEEVDPAIVDAKYNAQLNKIDNAAFFAGDVRKMLTDEFAQEHGMPDVLITDPPRAGMHADVVQHLLNFAPPKIVYVSCNPVTQARDLQLLSEKYVIEKVQPVDMFPHTAHIENVVLLSLKK